VNFALIAVERENIEGFASAGGFFSVPGRRSCDLAAFRSGAHFFGSEFAGRAFVYPGRTGGKSTAPIRLLREYSSTFPATYGRLALDPSNVWLPTVVRAANARPDRTWSAMELNISGGECLERAGDYRNGSQPIVWALRL